MNNELKKYEFEVDLRGNRDSHFLEYVLTRRDVKSAVMSFADDLRPLECNVTENIIQGNKIHLAKKEDVILNKNYHYNQFADDAFNANYHAGIKEMLASLKLVLKQKLKNNV